MWGERSTDDRSKFGGCHVRAKDVAGRWVSASWRDARADVVADRLACSSVFASVRYAHLVAIVVGRDAAKPVGLEVRDDNSVGLVKAHLEPRAIRWGSTVDVVLELPFGDGVAPNVGRRVFELRKLAAHAPPAVHHDALATVVIAIDVLGDVDRRALAVESAAVTGGSVR